MTREEALENLKQGVKDHILKVVDNVLTSAFDEQSITTAVKRFSVGVENARRFHEQAVQVIEQQFGS